MADPKPRSPRPRTRSSGPAAAPKRRTAKVAVEPVEPAPTPVDAEADGLQVAVVADAFEEAPSGTAPSWAKPMRWFTRPSSATRRGWEAEARRRAELADAAG